MQETAIVRFGSMWAILSVYALESINTIYKIDKSEVEK